MEKYILSILFIVFLFDIPVVKSTLSVFSTEKTYFTTNTYSEFNILRIKRNATKLSNKNESNTFEIPKSTREENKNQDQRELIKTTENITEKIVENDRKDSDEEPLVKTDSGMLRGLNMNIKGVKYYRFSKIPFAEKPIRFQPSRPVNPWKGIKDATVEQKGCLQRLLFVNKTRGSEDCLYLNINTPTLQNEKLPVLIWIYGGAFKFGTASNGYYDPGRFIEENVIVVTINYRMGALGFLATNTEHAPGNVGMKDIVIGLRWIKKNIHFFGGDSNNICLYGVSSGAGVVEYLTLSPMASGLYHKAIIHSGSALCEVFYVKRPLENAFKLGKHLGLITKNVSELMTFLQNVDARDITYAQDNMDKDHLYPFYLHFVPITEEYQSDEVFLNESPENILKSGKYEQIPTLFGFNDKEGFLFANHRGNMTTFLNLYSKMYEYIMPPSIMSKVDAKQKIEILQEVKELYFKNKSLGIEAIGEFIDFSGDSVFTYGLHRSVKIRSQTSKYSPYYYEFAFTEKNSVYEIGDLKIIGAGHADDTRYTFKLFGVSQADPKSEAFAKKYVRLFTNFMRHGDPTPTMTDMHPIKWLPVESNKLKYLKLTNKFEMKEDPFKQRYDFWDRAYSKCS